MAKIVLLKYLLLCVRVFPSTHPGVPIETPPWMLRKFGRPRLPDATCPYPPSTVGGEIPRSKQPRPIAANAIYRSQPSGKWARKTQTLRQGQRGDAETDGACWKADETRGVGLRHHAVPLLSSRACAQSVRFADNIPAAPEAQSSSVEIEVVDRLRTDIVVVVTASAFDVVDVGEAAAIGSFGLLGADAEVVTPNLSDSTHARKRRRKS